MWNWGQRDKQAEGNEQMGDSCDYGADTGGDWSGTLTGKVLKEQWLVAQTNSGELKNKKRKHD